MSEDIPQRVDDLESNINAALEKSTAITDLEKINADYFSPTGSFTLLFEQFKHQPIEQKRLYGEKINGFKKKYQLIITQKIKTLELANKKNPTKRFIPLTAYSPVKSHSGGLHPYTQVIEKIEDIFLSMGYTFVDAPEVDTPSHNFDALNLPADHPARDMYDTLWLENSTPMLLRTHTSNVEPHALKKHGVPLAIFHPGRCFRYESVDASHDTMFMQCEGLFVGKNVTMGHLIGTAKSFLEAFFEKQNLDIRIRPGYFPFVEPGIEIDMRCPFCTEGCSVCKRSTWLEIFPGGMTHPNVLKSAGIDPHVYSGFAFGFGLSRLVMLLCKINDVRHLSSGKMFFLEQF